MKGRIYKNRLSSSSNDLQPYIGQSPTLYNNLYHQQQSPLKPSFNLNYNYQSTGSRDRFTRSINNNNNNNYLEQSEAFYKSPNGTIINKLYEKDKPSYVSVQSRAGMHKPSINQQMSALADKLTMLQPSQIHNSRFLKRIVSNPDLHYPALSIPQQQLIEQPIIDHQQQQQLRQNQPFLNNSTAYNNRPAMLSPNRMGNRTPVKKGSGFGVNDSSQVVGNNNNINKRAFAYQVENNNNNFSTNSQMRTQIGPRSFHSAIIPQSSPFIIPTNNNDNSHISTTDYISSYQKRHKQRITNLQSQHQMELQFYQSEIKAKDQIIEEMSRALREKEEIIKKLQNQNANLTSRSYVSFANCANNSCRE